MAPQSRSWTQIFSSFEDKRIWIMLMLGCLAGMPLALIGSTVGIWLGEAGFDRAIITMFGWAALGYSFKFIWAALIDALPIPLMTKKLGYRRGWLILAQFMVVCAILFMAMIDPSQGDQNLQLLAIAAVLLGFSSATQDIVIDAYRIELAPNEDIQPMLAGTYAAGYRLGMIISSAGGLTLATYYGSAMGNYLYQAWQYTYFTIAGIFGFGILLTLLFAYEPKLDALRQKPQYKSLDYVRLFAVFLLAVSGFVLSFVYLGGALSELKNSNHLFNFFLGSVRLLGSLFFAFVVGYVSVRLGIADRQIAYRTWIEPITDFFIRYGLKLSIFLLLLVGLYRISDIMLGNISAPFYQDLNYTKLEMASIAKTGGVTCLLLGGLLGGLLAQKYHVMKLMFVGALLSCLTNLIFVGMIRSGDDIGSVSLQVGTQSYNVKPDESGRWELPIDQSALTNAKQMTATSTVQNGSTPIQVAQQVEIAVIDPSQTKIRLNPLSNDNVLSQTELKHDVVYSGQVYGLNDDDVLSEVMILVGNENITAKVAKQGRWETKIQGSALAQKKELTVQAKVINQGQVRTIKQNQSYRIEGETPSNYLMTIKPLDAMDASAQGQTMIQGKVIVPYSIVWLWAAIIFDNLAAGFASAVFIAFLSSLTNISFTATQFAIFSSLMTLLPKLLSGYSGTMVNYLGHSNFFLLTMAIGLPILVLIVIVHKLLIQHDKALEQG